MNKRRSCRTESVSGTQSGARSAIRVAWSLMRTS